MSPLLILHQKQLHSMLSHVIYVCYPPPKLEDVAFHSSYAPVKTESSKFESVARCDRTPSDHSFICFPKSDPTSALACMIFVCVPKMVQHNSHAISLLACERLCHFGSLKCFLICVSYDPVCIFCTRYYITSHTRLYLCKIFVNDNSSEFVDNSSEFVDMFIITG